MVISEGLGDNAKGHRELQGNQNWEQAIVFDKWESLVALD